MKILDSKKEANTSSNSLGLNAAEIRKKLKLKGQGQTDISKKEEVFNKRHAHEKRDKMIGDIKKQFSEIESAFSQLKG